MTSTIWAHTRESVVVATDTAVSVRGDAGMEFAGHQSKMLVLPHVNAVFTGGGSAQCKSLIEDRVKGASATTARELRRQMPSILRREHRRYLDHYAHLLDLDDDRDTACATLLATHDGVFLYTDADDYQETPLGKGVFADPKLDGSTRVPGPFKGDRQIFYLMQRQCREAPAWRYIGGNCVRARIHRHGISVATLGKLERTEG